MTAAIARSRAKARKGLAVDQLDFFDLLDAGTSFAASPTQTPLRQSQRQLPRPAARLGSSVRSSAKGTR